MGIIRVFFILLLAVTVSSAAPEGIVNRVKGERVVLSLGMLDGVRIGDRVLIYRAESFVHPFTGEKIEIPKLKVAEVTVTDVGNLFSEAMLTWGEMPIRKGDRVELMDEEKKDQKALADTGKTAVQSDTIAFPPRINTADVKISPRSSTPKPRNRSSPTKVEVAKRSPSIKRTPAPVKHETPAVEGRDSTSVSPSVEEPRSVAGKELDIRYKEALAVLKQAGKRNDPKTIDAHYWVGQYYYRMKNYAKAAEHFGKVVEGGGNNTRRNTALYNLAMCYYEMHKGEPAGLDQAKKTFQQVIDSFPNTPSATQAAGWIETIEWLQRVEREQRQKEQTTPEKPKEQTAPGKPEEQQESAAKIAKSKQH